MNVFTQKKRRTVTLAESYLDFNRNKYYKTYSFTVALVLFSIFVHPKTTFGFDPTSSGIETFANKPPVAETDFFTTNEDTSVSGNVLDNDHDPEGDPLHVTAGTITTAHGLVELHADGTFTYTPKANFNGQDSFSYIVCDNPSNTSCCNGKVKITVLPVQDAPITLPDLYTVNEDNPLNATTSVLENDVDPDGEPMTAVPGKPTSHGSIALNSNGTFTYTPAPDFHGTDTFTYYANDGIENSAETLVTITVNPINDAPIAVDDVISTDEDIPVDIPILTNDIDVDDILAASMIVVVTPPTHGTLVVNTSNGKVTYKPNLNYNGNDTFTYKLKDSSGALSNVATVSITVNPVNDAPKAATDVVTTPEEVPVLISVLLNDTDVDNAIDASSITLVGSPSNGTAVAQPSTGTFLYTPNKDYNGTDSFTYTVKDVEGKVSNIATVTITVTPVNDPPVAVDDEATTPKNTAVDIPVLLNDYDVDNDVVFSSFNVTTSPSHGTISFNAVTGMVNFIPTSDFVGDDYFMYTIQDPGGLVSTPATVRISVLHVNLPPVAVDDGPIQHETTLSLTIDVLANDYDPDNTHAELSIVSVTNPSVGSVSIVNGQIVYQPEGTISGTVTFTYTITDPEGLTDDALVTIVYVYKELIISQGFSPNGDGNNDTWYIQGIESYPNNLVKVFDRWGLLVYQKANYENTISPWDGRGNTGQQSGKLLDRGTYYYLLDPGDGSQSLNGYVIIIR